MSVNPRQKKNLREKIAVYILLLGILACAILFLNFSYLFQKPLFISPVGKAGNDIAMVEKKLREKNIQFSQVLILPDSAYLISIPNNRQVKLSSDKDIDKQTSSLQRILIQLTIDGKPFKSIDFRFSEPIISF